MEKKATKKAKYAPGRFNKGALLCKRIKKDGNPCRARAKKGREFCAIHGGNLPVGTEHPQYQHGGRSKYNGNRLLQKFEERLQDVQLHDLDKEIRLADAMLEVVLEGLSEDGLTDIWRDLRKAWTNFEFHQARSKGGDMRAMASATEALLAVGANIKAGSAEYEKRGELMRIQAHKAKLIDVEGKRLEKMGKMWPVDQVLMLVAQIAQAAKKIVTSDAEQLELANAIKSLIER